MRTKIFASTPIPDNRTVSDDGGTMKAENSNGRSTDLTSATQTRINALLPSIKDLFIG